MGFEIKVGINYVRNWICGINFGHSESVANSAMLTRFTQLAFKDKIGTSVKNWAKA